MEVTREQTYQEAVSHCKADEIILHTIELRHPHFTSEKGGHISIFLVKDYTELLARLETTHPTHGGKQVLFNPVAFELTPPSKETAVVPELQLNIDNVSSELMPYLDLAVSEEIPIKVIYREYILSDLEYPSKEPIIFEASVTTTTLTSMSTTCSMTNISTKSMPSIEYTSANFPNLVQ